MMIPPEIYRPRYDKGAGRPTPCHGRFEARLQAGSLLPAVALDPLALELARAADRGGLFTGALLARLLVVAAQLHFAIDAFALQLLLERAQGLVDIVFANHDLHKTACTSFFSSAGMTRQVARRRP